MINKHLKMGAQKENLMMGWMDAEAETSPGFMIMADVVVFL